MKVNPQLPPVGGDIHFLMDSAFPHHVDLKANSGVVLRGDRRCIRVKGVSNRDHSPRGSLLDVYSASDHSDRRSLRPELWLYNLHDTESWYESGEFVTLFGFEASYDWPVGHHNVYYARPEGDFWQIEYLDIREAWERSSPGEMLTIPHHTGATMSGPPGVTRIDWTIHDEEFRTAAEIYSSHGHNEEWAPNHPLSFDVSDFTWQGFRRTRETTSRTPG